MVKYGAFDREIKKYPENPSVGTDQPAQTCDRPQTRMDGPTTRARSREERLLAELAQKGQQHYQ